MESAWTSTGHVVQWESMTHIKPLKDLVEPGWAQALADVEPQIHLMGDFLRSEIAAGRKYLPASRNILRAFTIPFDDIKVLIVGQDPYPTPGHPVGLSFCVAPDVKPIPRSLANIYTELTDDLGVPMPANGDLTPWTKQGVMLLNRVLTVAPGAPASHRGWGWEKVTEHAIRTLAARGHVAAAQVGHHGDARQLGQQGGVAQLQGVACPVKFLGAVPHRLPVGAYRADGACRVAAALQQGVHRLGIGPG